MRRRFHLAEITLIIVGTVASGTLTAAAAGGRSGGQVAVRPGATAGSWGQAIEIPGLSALNTGGGVQVTSLSCGSSGNCAAGGSYRTGPGQQQAFVASEENGIWEPAIEVPGTAALNAGDNAEVLSVSCAPTGGCAAGGVYAEAGGAFQQAFVVSETGGSWGTAIEVPGSAALNRGEQAQVSSVSCPSAGNCAAGGTYVNSSDEGQAFVVSEQNGTWGTAIHLPFAGSAYYPDGSGNLNVVSCASAGTCAAGGDDSGPQPTFSDTSAFVANEKNGHWGAVRPVPGLAALDYGGPNLLSLSCASAGNCAAGGFYQDKSHNIQAFVVNEKKGTWGKAIEVPGSAALNTQGRALVSSVSCATARNCAAGGFASRRHEVRGFVVTEKNGTWGKALVEPGSGSLFGGRRARVFSVACAAAGNCVAGGESKDSSLHWQAFVISERGGTWGSALEIPGSAALNVGGHATVSAVSCAPRGSCVAVGTYRSSGGATQGFVVSQNGP